VTFKPLLLLVTVPQGKSLGPDFEKNEDFQVPRPRNVSLGGSQKENLRAKKSFFAELKLARVDRRSPFLIEAAMLRRLDHVRSSLYSLAISAQPL
jgi:hypothetical protein